MHEFTKSPESIRQEFEDIRSKFRRVLIHPFIPQSSRSRLLNVVDTATLLPHDQFLAKVLSTVQGEPANVLSRTSTPINYLHAFCTPDNHIFFDAHSVFNNADILNPFVIFAEEVANAQAQPEYEMELSEAIRQPMLIYPFTTEKDLLAHLNQMRKLQGPHGDKHGHRVSIKIKGFKSQLYDSSVGQTYPINPVHDSFEKARASLVKAVLINIYCGPLDNSQQKPLQTYTLGQRQAVTRLSCDPFMNEVHQYAFQYLRIISNQGNISPDQYVGELLEMLSTYTMQSYMQLLFENDKQSELAIFKKIADTFTRNKEEQLQEPRTGKTKPQTAYSLLN